jgi:hypothetical protein
MTVIVSMDSPSCEVPCLILHSVVHRDVTRQAKVLHCLKYVGALERGLAYLSRCNSGWFYHSYNLPQVPLWRTRWRLPKEPAVSTYSSANQELQPANTAHPQLAAKLFRQHNRCTSADQQSNHAGSIQWLLQVW